MAAFFRSFFHRRAAAQNDQVSQRDFLAAGLRTV